MTEAARRPTGTGRARWMMRWKPVVNAFALIFGDRWPAAETYGSTMTNTDYGIEPELDTARSMSALTRVAGAIEPVTQVPAGKAVPHAPKQSVDVDRGARALPDRGRPVVTFATTLNIALHYTLPGGWPPSGWHRRTERRRSSWRTTGSSFASDLLD